MKRIWISLRHIQKYISERLLLYKYRLKKNWAPLSIYIALHAIAYGWLSLEAFLIWIFANIFVLSVLGMESFLNQKTRYLKPIPVSRERNEGRFFEGGCMTIQPANIQDIPQKPQFLSNRQKDNSIYDPNSFYRPLNSKVSASEVNQSITRGPKDRFSDLDRKVSINPVNRTARADSFREKDDSKIIHLREKVVPRQKLLLEQRKKELEQSRQDQEGQKNAFESKEPDDQGKVDEVIATKGNKAANNMFGTPFPELLVRARSTPPYTSNFVDALSIRTQKVANQSSFNPKSPTNFYRRGEKNLSPIKPQISQEVSKVQNFSMIDEPKLWEDLEIEAQKTQNNVSSTSLSDEDYINHFKKQIKRLPVLWSYSLSKEKMGHLANKIAGSSVQNPSVKLSKLFDKLAYEASSTKKIACHITLLIESYQYESAKADGQMLYMSLINQLISLIVHLATKGHSGDIPFIKSLATLAHIVNLRVPGFVDTLFYHLASQNKSLIPKSIHKKPAMEEQEYYKKLGYSHLIDQDDQDDSSFKFFENFLKTARFFISD